MKKIDAKEFLIAIIILLIVYYIRTQATLNFGWLAVIYILWIIFFFKAYIRRVDESESLGIFRNEKFQFAILGSLSILVFALLGIKTLDNYFNANENIYKNIDHHAVRVDGIDISAPQGYLLAQNSSAAFFDSGLLQGKARINDIEDSTSIKINLENFSQSIYINKYDNKKRCVEQTLINKESLVSFDDSEILYFKKHGQDGYYKFYTEINEELDSVSYHLVLPDGVDIVSEETRFLTKGLSMEHLTRSVHDLNIDLSGIHIVRNTIYPTIKKRDRYDKYRGVGYSVEVHSDYARDNTSEILFGTDTTKMRKLSEAAEDISIDIPYNATFVLGYNNQLSLPAYFEKKATNMVSLLYRQPQYHYFTHPKERDYNSITILSSMMIDNGNAASMPENMILFDLFDHSDNVNNIVPVSLSYVAGPTNQLVKFVYNDSNNSSAELNVDSDVNYFPGIVAQMNPRVAWNIGVENFKILSPFQPSKISWTIFIVAIAMILLLRFGARRMSKIGDKTYDVSARNCFSLVEFTAYTVTLYFVIFRMFLLWRTSVFPPVESINYYEFGLFRYVDNWDKFILVLLASGLIILILKLFVWYSPLAYKKYRSFIASLERHGIIRLFNRIYGIVAQYALSIWSGIKNLGGIIAWLLKSIPGVQATIRFFIVCYEKIKGIYFSVSWYGKIMRSVMYIPIEIFRFFIKTPGGIWLRMLITILIAVVCWISRGKAWLVITLPVVSYILISSYINRKYYSYYKLSTKKFWQLRFSDTPVKALVWNIIFTAVYSLMLLVIDSGYGIIFLTFGIVWLVYSFYHFNTSVLPRRKVGRIVVSIALFSLLLLLIGCYKYLFSFILKWSPFMLGSAFAVLGFVIAIALLYLISWGSKKSGACIAVVFSVFFAFVAVGAKSFLEDKAPHTVQRISVLFDDPVESMSRIIDDETEYRYLQAAENNMIIGEYARRGRDVKLIGEGGEGYFKMQPHSKVGALWGAQLTDICLIRFVVAEHSPLLPFLFIIFFILMVWAGMRMPWFNRGGRTILVQIPLLLFVQSLLIWMATTKKFIFLGQDFPMISINSRLTLVFYFVLMVLWVFVAVYESANFYRLDREYARDHESFDKDDITENRWRIRDARADSTRIALFLFACVSLIAFIGNNKSEEEESFSVQEGLINSFVKTIKEEINPLLLEYQDSLGNKILLDHDISSDIKKFDREMNIPILFDGPDSLFQRRQWENFRDRYSKDNKSTNFIHAHLRRNKVVLSVRSGFYDKKLPSPKDEQWKGSLIANSNSVDTLYRIESDSSTAYRLPAEWMSDGMATAIIHGEGLTIHKPYPEQEIYLKDGIYSSAVIRSNETVEISDQKLNSIIPHKEYWARSVMVNGQRTFFYPLGSSFYWIKNLAEDLSVQYTAIEKEKRTPDFNADVELTISPTLTRSVRDVLDNNYFVKSVIAANGDGEVVLMADYVRKYNLNPNDRKFINKLRDSLFMKGAVVEERNWFANRNLLHMAKGPGSSQKPLVWTAVASKVEYDWKNLMLSAYDGRVKRQEGNFVFKQFNGGDFRYRDFATLESDERYGASISLKDYMTHSSNIYNAAMIYIGSFANDELSNINQMSSNSDAKNIFALYSGKDFLERFPIFSKDNRKFSFNKKPIYKYANSTIFQVSMEEMFFNSLDSNGTLLNVGSGVLDMKYPSGYLYVEAPGFNKRDYNDEANYLEHAIRFTAIGAGSIWRVSPWTMAESMGRMASLNKDYTLNVFKREKPSYAQFPYLSEGYINARPYQFKGMSNVLSSGTAKRMADLVGLEIVSDKSNKVKVDGHEYFIYAKTGTIGDSKNDNNHRLSVIVTNKDLVETPVSDLQDMRYYVIYFAYEGLNKDNWPQYSTIIRIIMNSEEFRKYMND